MFIRYKDYMQASCHNQGTLLTLVMISSLLVYDNAHFRKSVFTKPADLQQENGRRQDSDISV